MPVTMLVAISELKFGNRNRRFRSILAGSRRATPELEGPLDRLHWRRTVVLQFVLFLVPIVSCDDRRRPTGNQPLPEPTGIASKDLQYVAALKVAAKQYLSSAQESLDRIRLDSAVYAGQVRLAQEYVVEDSTAVMMLLSFAFRASTGDDWLRLDYFNTNRETSGFVIMQQSLSGATVSVYASRQLSAKEDVIVQSTELPVKLLNWHALSSRAESEPNSKALRIQLNLNEKELVPLCVEDGVTAAIAILDRSGVRSSFVPITTFSRKGQLTSPGLR